MVWDSVMVPKIRRSRGKSRQRESWWRMYRGIASEESTVFRMKQSLETKNAKTRTK